MSHSLYGKLYRRFGKMEPEISAQSAKRLEAGKPTASTAAVSAGCQARLKNTRVAIVGGGFAGVMAAWCLGHQEREMEVVLFEAGDDVGGRVRSDEKLAKGRITEFGAELVGVKHTTWLSLARELGIGMMVRTGEDHYAVLGLEMKHRIDGKDIGGKEGEAVAEKMEEIFKEFGKDAKLIKDAAAPFNQPELQKFDQMSVADKLEQLRPKLKIDKLTLREMEVFLGNDLVTPLAKINYLALLCLVKAGQFGDDKEDPDLLGFWRHNETFRCTDGNQSLVRRMVAKLADPKEKFKFTLALKTPVLEIKIDPANLRPVTLKWKPSDAAAKLNPNVGFDYVILAVPPSVWGGITITPQHPKDVLEPIQMGPAVKYFSGLKDRFWIRENAAPSGISSDIGMIWEGTDNQTQVGDQEIVLSHFAGGFAKSGRVLTEPDFQREIKKFYPGYEKSNSGRKTRLVNWAETEEFIKTGYSCPRPGHIFQTAPSLQKPFNGGRLFLAGEHTETDFFGFMEGALRSGCRAAKGVIAKVCPGDSAGFPNS
ncbi:MAG TPA: FAD-dependent oxidoreductase [Thermoanaerobaculia bacterium]|nr:FAD-dependent oxidoreductase [Thermoanaerobaculia bacterium]